MMAEPSAPPTEKPILSSGQPYLQSHSLKSLSHSDPLFKMAVYLVPTILSTHRQQDQVENSALGSVLVGLASDGLCPELGHYQVRPSDMGFSS